MSNENENVLNESEEVKQPTENISEETSSNPTAPENAEETSPVATVEPEAPQAEATVEPATEAVEEDAQDSFGNYIPEAAAATETTEEASVEQAPSEDEIAEHQIEQ